LRDRKREGRGEEEGEGERNRMSDGGRRKRETSSDTVWRDGERERDGESERGFTCRKMSNADKERCKDAAKSAQHDYNMITTFQNSERPCSSEKRYLK